MLGNKLLLRGKIYGNVIDSKFILCSQSKTSNAAQLTETNSLKNDSSPMDMVTPDNWLGSPSNQANHSNLRSSSNQPCINLNDSPLKVIIINCQSVTGKKALLDSLIYDVIVGTESWLNPSVKSSEIFAPQFEAFRQDRSDGYGGVFLACSKMYNWECFGFTNSYNNVEVVACKLKTNHHLLIFFNFLNKSPIYFFFHTSCVYTSK